MVMLPESLLSSAKIIKANATQSTIAVWGRRPGYDTQFIANAHQRENGASGYSLHDGPLQGAKFGFVDGDGHDHAPL